MEIMKVLQGQPIAMKNEKVKYWYLLQEGVVYQQLGTAQVRLEKNAVIGILERDIYMCDYIAAEDSVLAAFVCESVEDLQKILSGQEKIRNIFLRSAIGQRYALLQLYSELYNKAKQFHMFVETVYNDYKNLCGKYWVEEQMFPKMEHFNPLVMQHMAEDWEIHNCERLAKTYMKEYLQLMERDESLTVGVIMEAAAQMRRFSMGIGEIEAYLAYNKEILLSENKNDLFGLYFELSIQMHAKKYDMQGVREKLQLIRSFAEQTALYTPRMISRRWKEFKEYDYSDASRDVAEAGGVAVRKEVDITAIDCLEHILEYAGYGDEESDQISKQIKIYRNLPDMYSSDPKVYALRKALTAIFYDIYYRVFIRAVKDEESLTPILEMFLNFGFMDLSYVGEELAKELYDLCAHLDICRSEHVFTIYEWLNCIYRGEKEPSKNEFDMNYAAYLADQLKRGQLIKEQVQQQYGDMELRVKFEIQNMFTSVNKLTYGKVTTFCPILCSDDMINTVEKMLVTVDKLEQAMNVVRKVDYSVFYRDIVFSDPEKGINTERLKKEILPEIILMPNAGTRGMMWQECSGMRSSTPGRFMFPILTSVELNDLMLDAIGQFRWEICRKEEGIHWNDIREKSLTAEYCTYIQFYRKNHDLSADAKERIKGALARAKNNYREVFVRDYVNWIRFESRGSFRLNKVSRDILVRYCPFAGAIRNELRSNPLYQTSITRFEAENAKKLQHYNGMCARYVKAGGEITPDLKNNLLFYQM